MSIVTAGPVLVELATDESGFKPVACRGLTYDGDRLLTICPIGPLPVPPITSLTQPCLVRVTVCAHKAISPGRILWAARLSYLPDITIALEYPLQDVAPCDAVLANNR